MRFAAAATRIYYHAVTVLKIHARILPIKCQVDCIRKLMLTHNPEDVADGNQFVNVMIPLMLTIAVIYCCCNKYIVICILKIQFIHLSPMPKLA